MLFSGPRTAAALASTTDLCVGCWRFLRAPSLVVCTLRYKELLAERDLEEMYADLPDMDADPILGEDKSSCSCLWGNPCISPANCKDWRNRIEVATKHGWKGF